jgi:hypothetical protein
MEKSLATAGTSRQWLTWKRKKLAQLQAQPQVQPQAPRQRQARLLEVPTRCQ